MDTTATHTGTDVHETGLMALWTQITEVQRELDGIRGVFWRTHEAAQRLITLEHDVRLLTSAYALVTGRNIDTVRDTLASAA